MRTPVYTKDREHRIVSRPSDTWQCQTNDRTGSSKEYDPWRNNHRPTSKIEALRQLAALGEIKGD